MKIRYFLDHPQLKRKKAAGNGTTPREAGSTPQPTASSNPQPSSSGSKPSIAAQINFGGKFKK